MLTQNKTLEIINLITQPDFTKEVLELRSKNKEGKMHPYFFDDLETLGYKIESLKKDSDIFFGVAARKDKSSGKKNNCSSVSALWLDIDYGNEGHKKVSLFNTKDEVLEHISRSIIKPSIIVDSGYGVHLYFLLKEKIELDAKSIESVETLNKKLALLFGGDSTHDVSRILRVPGTDNHKLSDLRSCSIIECNTGALYDIDSIESLPICEIDWKKIKSLKLQNQPLYDILFGKDINELGKESRSEADQAIIVKLLDAGLTREQVQIIFETFPTTGKYFSQESKQDYLILSMDNAQKYLNDSFEHSHIIKEDEGIPPFYEVVTEDLVEIKDLLNATMCNFVVRINRIVKKVRDGKVYSSLDGELIFAKKLCLPFYDESADILYKADAFQELINHLAPTKPVIQAPIKALLAAINYLNRDPYEVIEKEFGFNNLKNEFITSNLRITKQDIIKESTPIKYSEIWGNNKLGFTLITQKEAEVVKLEILKKFIPWDKLEVILTALAFSFLPIIYPFIADKLPNKFYLMFMGKSGSGKTLLAKICQNFYGIFRSLVSWTSTDTSINIIGNAFKDALFVVDDFKKQNFKNENAIKNAMAIIQNYSDGTGRQRGNVDLALKDERFIKGWLMLSAEDVVFTESSSIARGIILPIDSKKFKPKEAEEILELSKKFNGLMPWLIQFILHKETADNINDLLTLNRQLFYKLAEDRPEISLDNLSRIINNFAVLKTSWDFISRFLISNKEIRDELSCKYISQLENLFLENIFRIDESKSERMFEQTLWSMVDSQKLHFEKVLNDKFEYSNSQRGIKTGEYAILKDNKIKICLNLKTAFKEITKYNSDIQISYDTLKDALLKSDKIRYNKSEKVFFREGKHGNGVEWIGSFPKNLFGLNEDNIGQPIVKLIIPRLEPKISKKAIFQPIEDQFEVTEETWDSNDKWNPINPEL